MSDAELQSLRAVARAIERHYGCAQDIEWAVDRMSGEILILQSRPETVWSAKDDSADGARGRESADSRDVDLRRPPVTLTAKDVAEITRLLEQSSFDELDLEIDGLKLHLKRGAAVPVQPATDSAAVAYPRRQRRPARGGAPADRPDCRRTPICTDVHAPLLGTFYRAPKPGEPPFVEVGSRVEPDTIIGIIEVMKLMNTVRVRRSRHGG